jgi:hypothetical protein
MLNNIGTLFSNLSNIFFKWDVKNSINKLEKTNKKQKVSKDHSVHQNKPTNKVPLAIIVLNVYKNTIPLFNLAPTGICVFKTVWRHLSAEEICLDTEKLAQKIILESIKFGSILFIEIEDEDGGKDGEYVATSITFETEVGAQQIIKSCVVEVKLMISESLQVPSSKIIVFDRRIVTNNSKLDKNVIWSMKERLPIPIRSCKKIEIIRGKKIYFFNNENVANYFLEKLQKSQAKCGFVDNKITI